MKPETVGGRIYFPHHCGTPHFSSPQQASYRLRQQYRDENGILRERKIPSPSRPGLMACIGLRSGQQVVEECARWNEDPPGANFVYENETIGCQAGAGMDIWAVGIIAVEVIRGASVFRSGSKGSRSHIRKDIKL